MRHKAHMHISKRHVAFLFVCYFATTVITYVRSGARVQSDVMLVKIVIRRSLCGLFSPAGGHKDVVERFGCVKLLLRMSVRNCLWIDSYYYGCCDVMYVNCGSIDWCRVLTAKELIVSFHCKKEAQSTYVHCKMPCGALACVLFYHTCLNACRIMAHSLERRTMLCWSKYL